VTNQPRLRLRAGGAIPNDERKMNVGRDCRTPGCYRQTERLSGRCAKCESAKRLNGDYKQRAVTQKALHGHLMLANDCRKRTKPEQWIELDAQWDRVVEIARETVSEWRGGKAMHRPTVQAADEIIKLAEGGVKAEDVVNVSLAMSSAYWNDTLIRTDESFLFQWVRQVRKLGSMSLGQRWDNRQQRTRRVYRAMPPAAVREMAMMLKGAFGLAGVAFARSEKARKERVAADKAKLKDALGKLFDSESPASGGDKDAA
jgi:hypothetical protein